MNAAEQIVEAYFRVVRSSFTMSDVKVAKGFGRQFDLLAVCPKTNEQFHVEISVKHDMSFNMTIDETMDRLEQKFFGTPKSRASGSYLDAIKATYRTLGIDFQKVTRVWVPWTVADTDDPSPEMTKQFRRMARSFGVRNPNFELLLFRKQVLVDLAAAVGTANYEDPTIRTMSFVNQFILQTTRATTKEIRSERRRRAY